MKWVLCLYLSIPLCFADRLTDLTQELRCMVCDNQTIYESHAPLAKSMRAVVAAQIEKGHTDDEIRHYMQQRYGDVVLYKPPLTPRTWLLWCLPFFAMVGTIILIVQKSRRSKMVKQPSMK